MNSGKTILLVGGLGFLGYGLYRYLRQPGGISPTINLNIGWNYVTYIGSTKASTEVMGSIIDHIRQILWYDEGTNAWYPVAYSDDYYIHEGWHMAIEMTKACTIENFEWWEG